MVILGTTLWLAICLASPSLQVQPQKARPGDAVLVDVLDVTTPPTGRAGKMPLKFLKTAQGFRALTGLSVEESLGPLRIDVQLSTGEWLHDVLEVVEAKFSRRLLSVEKKYTSPPKSVRRWMAEDKKAFAEAFSTFSPTWQFEDEFAWPRASRVTAPFGDLRLLNGKKNSQHFGTDLDGNIGDVVFASQAGTVVMRRTCYAAGNTVLLHHGGNLFTAYFHLSSFEVDLGQKVNKGEPLGAVGKTGRVTGPHLHFGVKIEDRWVDPESVLRLRFHASESP